MAGKLRRSSDPGRDRTGRKGKGRINAREYRASMFAHYHAGFEIAAV